MQAPGLFFYLLRDAVISIDSLAELLARLPDEQIIRTAVRGGEAFDSTRWPAARDATLASVAARSMKALTLDRALAEIDRAGDDLEQLRALVNASIAALGERREHDVVVANLISAHLGAAEQLYAYHVHRGVPGGGAESAAWVVRAALERGSLELAELVRIAIMLVEHGASTRASGESVVRLDAATSPR